jgi:hypothetical protein
MTIDIEGLFRQEAFRNVEPARLDAMKKFAAQINGRSTAEIMPVLIQFSKELSKGRAFSKQESDAMLAAICDALPEAERNRLNGIIKMLASK